MTTGVPPPKAKTIYIALLLLFKLWSAETKVEPVCTTPEVLRSNRFTHELANRTRFSFTCPFVDRYWCDPSMHRDMTLTARSGKSSCKIPKLSASEWPRSRKTIWIVCDSTCRQLFVSISCQLQEILEPIIYPITPGVQLSSSHKCVHSVFGGRICFYFAGCFTGDCFLPMCPVLKRNVGKIYSCLEEVTSFVQRGDIVFIGLGVHIHENEGKKLKSELSLFKQYYPKLLDKVQRIFWLTSSAQHFASTSGRFASKKISERRRLLRHPCRRIPYSREIGRAHV